jgi:hypothetical protein
MAYVSELNADHLRKEELAYELKARGIKVTVQQTSKELRACLSPLLKLERGKKGMSYSAVEFDVDEELVVVDSRLTELEEAVKRFDDGSSRIPREVLRTRASHLLGRVQRLESSATVTEAQLTTIASRVSRITLLLTHVLKTDDSGADLSIAFAGVTIDLDSDSDSDTGLPVSSTPPSTAAATSNVVTRSQPVERWNLKFSGDGKGISLHHFLERVSELQIARHVSNQQLYESAIDLFSGKALWWYRAHQDRFHDWEGLTSLLRRHYEPPDYRSRLFQDMLHRTQDETESFVEYFACMNSMFRRYGDMTDETKLHMVTRNLAPFYTMQLPLVRTLRELEDECLKLEVKKYRSDHYHPPTRVRRSYVEPDFAFVSTQGNARSSEMMSVPYSPNNAPQFSSPDSVPPCEANAVNHATASCWNCLKTGHVLRNCPAPRKLLCYRCGKHGVTTRNCPTCSTGNEVRRN